MGIARSRTGWLVAFCVGLLLAAVVVEQFEDVLEHHVSEQRHGRDDHRQAGNDAVAVCCYTLLRTNSVGGSSVHVRKDKEVLLLSAPGARVPQQGFAVGSQPHHGVMGLAFSHCASSHQQ